MSGLYDWPTRPPERPMITEEQRRGMALHSLARFAIREALEDEALAGGWLSDSIIKRARKLGLGDDVERLKACNLREYEATRAGITTKETDR